MNGLLSGLASAQGNKGGKNNNRGNGGFGGGGILWILVLLFLAGGTGLAGQNDGGTVCGCDPKHVKKLCKVGGSTGNGYGGLGLGGFGGGLGADGGGIWIIIILLLCFCGGNKNRGCTNNIINVDSDEDC
ncbi:MAG: hypothetical protein N2B06_16320 [Clostridium sp.]